MITPRNKVFLLCGVLFIVGIAFSPSLFNGFSKNDDPVHLLENPTLRSLSSENFRAMFQDIINTTYVPLTTISFAVEYYFFGYNPFVYHLDNLLLHLAVTALVFLFLRKLELSDVAALVGALFFGIHPLHVESVAWITERKDVLYALFYMLALLQYVQYAQSQNRIYYWLSVGLCFLSVLAKPMALSLPLILLLWDWWTGRGWEKNLLEKIPYVVVGSVIAGITYLHNARVPWRSVSEALMLWIWCFVFYIDKFFRPDNLIVFYQYPQPLSWNNPHFFLSALFFCGLLFSVFYFRRNRLFVFAILFYFFSIFFLLRFDDVENINPVSDRFMYLPSLGFCALLGAGFAGLIENKKQQSNVPKNAIVALVFLALLLGTKTFLQCRAWRDGANLWSDVIKQSPQLALAYVQRGAAYQEKKDLLSALSDYRKAISLKDNAYAHSNMAMIFKDARHFDEAIVEYTKAIKLKPDFWGAYFDRANLYRETQRSALAIADYTKVLQLLPGYAEAYSNRGTAHFLNNEDDLALQDFNRAIRFDPRAINAINNRAVIHARRGRFEAAIKDFSRSIVLDPKNAAVYFNRGLAYAQSRQYDLAITDFTKALQLDPGYEEASLQKMEVMKKDK